MENGVEEIMHSMHSETFWGCLILRFNMNLQDSATFFWFASCVTLHFYGKQFRNLLIGTISRFYKKLQESTRFPQFRQHIIFQNSYDLIFWNLVQNLAKSYDPCRMSCLNLVHLSLKHFESYSPKFPISFKKEYGARSHE